MAVSAIHPGEHLAEELEALNMSAAELARQLAPVIADRVADGVGLLGLLEQYAPGAVGEVVEWRIEVRGVREVYQAMGLSPHVAASRLLSALRAASIEDDDGPGGVA